jgi:hypothetical protein
MATMTETRTRTATTAVGEVQYETVECCSCGQEVAKEEATEVGIKRQQKRRRQRYRTTTYVCGYCHEQGNMIRIYEDIMYEVEIPIPILVRTLLLLFLIAIVILILT